ncbi:MAG TPA: 3-phosphoshikimate 1-carboxyvinyltransferase [Acidimicrobiales bacterium]
MTGAVQVAPIDAPFDLVVDVPGSKSLTNRALLLAALADGTSEVQNVLRADDADAMIGALRGLGVSIDVDGTTARVDGVGGRFDPPAGARVDARSSGTTARFLLPVLAVASSRPVVLDGSEQLRRRPMGDLVEAVRAIGGTIEGGPTLPVTVSPGARGRGVLHMPGNVTSQFLSALMMAAPLRGGLTIESSTEIVGRTFVEMTAMAMWAFGGSAHVDPRRVVVEPGRYRSRGYFVEPDASAAAYFFAAAAITGSKATVNGLAPESLQGDIEFLGVLARMGADVRWRADRLAVGVRGTGALHGVDQNFSRMPDQALTAAAIAPFADSPTRIRGVGFIRGHESDRIAAATTELRRLGVTVDEHDDGWTIHPSAPTGGLVETYDDHRMAMAFALVGLRVPGVEIADASCVGKTFPGFWETLSRLRPG